MRAVGQIAASAARCLGVSTEFGLAATRSFTTQTSSAVSELTANANASTSGRDAADIISKHSMSLPHLKQQVLLAKVISVSKGKVLVDPGYFGFCSFPKDALSVDQIYNPQKDLLDRAGKSDVRPGDMLKFRLSEFFSPYGEMHLEPLKTRGDAQSKMVWEELRDAMTQRRKVQGRILNPCKEGYAVGIAGYVALYKHNTKAGFESAQKVRKVGVLQDFYIRDMDEVRKIIYLDPRDRGAGPVQRQENLYSNISAATTSQQDTQA